MVILDADKAGYLRSKTSLIQTIGRAARNLEGRVILYGDVITESMRCAMDETNRRRQKQQQYNLQHGITPESVKKSITDILESVYEKGDRVTVRQKPIEPHVTYLGKDLRRIRKTLHKKMVKAAENLEFEEAARLRDEIYRLESLELEL